MATGSANRLNQRETVFASAIPDLLVHLVRLVGVMSHTPRGWRRNERMLMATSEKGNATVSRTVVSFASPTSRRVTIRPAAAILAHARECARSHNGDAWLTCSGGYRLRRQQLAGVRLAAVARTTHSHRPLHLRGQAFPALRTDQRGPNHQAIEFGNAPNHRGGCTRSAGPATRWAPI